MAFELQSFLNKLKNDGDVKKGNNLKKIYNTRGTILFFPILAKTGFGAYTALNDVKEYSAPTNCANFEDEVWHQILPKTAYGEITPAQSALYDEVKQLWFRYEKLVKETQREPWRVARVRNYGLFYGYVLSHIKEDKTAETKFLKQACLLMFPTPKVFESLSTAIQTKAAIKGGSQFVEQYFTENTKDRTGALSVSIAGGRGGYQAQVSFEEVAPGGLFPVGLDLSEQAALCVNHVKDFLGWQSGNGSALFNDEVFAEMRSQLEFQCSELENAPKLEDEDEEAGEPAEEPSIY